MKSFIQFFIKKRNPLFKFDNTINNEILLSLIWMKLKEIVRGLKVIFYLKKPQLIFLGRNVSFFYIRNIDFGKWVTIGAGCHLSGLGKGRLKIGNSVGIGAYSQIIISTTFNNIGEYITIGNNVGIGQFASLGGSGGLEIGDNCIIGQYFSCHPENHNFESCDKLIREQGTTRGVIKIENDCWIGAKVTILANVVIGAHSVVAAGSVVTKSFPPYSIIAGVPAKIIKERL